MHHFISFLFSWERPAGCIIPKLHGQDPVACIVFNFRQDLPSIALPSGYRLLI
jgi:hypothetical protein